MVTGIVRALVAVVIPGVVGIGQWNHPGNRLQKPATHRVWRLALRVPQVAVSQWGEGLFSVPVLPRQATDDAQAAGRPPG